MWHKGKVTRLDRDKLDGHFSLTTPRLYHDRIYFMFPKEYEPHLLRSICDDLEIEIYLSGHYNTVYNIIIDGQSIRKQEETI